MDIAGVKKSGGGPRRSLSKPCGCAAVLGVVAVIGAIAIPNT